MESVMWGKLEPVLKEIWNEHDFLLGVKLCVPTEENKKELLDAINNGLVEKESSAITEYAWAIYNDDPFED